MALPDQPAQRHREIARVFTDKVNGTDSWDVPAPVPDWTARDVVRHLVEWLPAFLAGGSSVRLLTVPPVDDDPVGAWHAHVDAVQARCRHARHQPRHHRGAARHDARPRLLGEIVGAENEAGKPRLGILRAGRQRRRIEDGKRRLDHDPQPRAQAGVDVQQSLADQLMSQRHERGVSICALAPCGRGLLRRSAKKDG